jgi:uncharacterized membrane protein YczE
MTDDRTLDAVRSVLDADDLAAAEALHGPIEGWTWATALLVGELLRQRLRAAERAALWGDEL